MKHSNSAFWRLATLAAVAFTLTHTTMATQPGHNVSAGLVNVTMNDSGTGASSINVTLPFTINDFRLRSGSTVGATRVQIGQSATDDGNAGVVMSCPTEHNKDYSGVIAGGGLSNVCSAAYVDASGQWNIATFGVMGQAAGSNPRLNVNEAGAYFPFSTWIGGWVKNSTAINGGPMDTLIASSLLTLDTNDNTKGWYIDNGSGISTIDLRNLGISSISNGVLLATGAKNETANLGLTSTNADGTWKIFIHDDGANGSNHEQDPIGFVFIPKTNTTIVSGRFNSSGNIEIFSGNAPQFTVTSNALGTYELKLIGKSATNGVLILSPEGGRATSGATAGHDGNQDNYVSYALNSTQDGWIIKTHDCPLGGVESIPPGQAIASFAFIPAGSPGFTMTPSNNVFTTENGGTGTFTVALDTQPTADVTFSVSTSNPNEGTVDVSSLTFTSDNWAQPQTVTVTGVDDVVSDGTVFYTIDFGVASSADPNYNGFKPQSVTVGNIDNDPGITVTPINGLFTTEGGGTATFNVHLNTQPSATVTISISSSNPNEGTVSTPQLLFDSNNWNQDQTVTVTGVDDFVQDGDVPYTIVTGTAQSTDSNYGGSNPPDVAVVNRDNDTASLVVSAYPAGLSVVEGRSGNYTVRLASQPTANVTVNLVSTDTTQGGTVSPSSLLFTPANWSNSQPVTVTGADDLTIDGATAWFITNSVNSSDPNYAALAAIGVSVQTLDNEPTITLPSGTTVWGVGMPPVGIDGRATVSDPNTIDYTGTTLTVTITNNGTANDRLSIRNEGTAAGQIGTSGNSVTYGGVQIGTFSSGSGAALVVTFNGAATTAAVEATLHAASFSNVNPSPALALRNISAVLRHADGGQSSGTVAIRVGLLRAAEFQEGADHGYGVYTGENDIQLVQGSPNTAFPAGSGNGLFIDWPDAGKQNAFESLVRFDNIFGSGPGQIPSNAVVVEALLTFHVNDSGDGSPLYRMTQDWDATNLTWGTDGITIGSQTQPGADSVWGLPDGSASTSTGAATISVLPDVNAWLHGGEVNHGWVMPGWNGNTDGTGISPSEDPVVAFRPDLRVLWLPPDVSSNSFRQNVNGYTSAVDTQIRGNDPTNGTFGLSATIGVDWNVVTPGDQSQVLMRFDNIIGTGLDQIPPGSQVHAAILDLTSQSGSAQGHGGTFHTMLIPWNDTDSFSTFGSGILANDVQASSAISLAAGAADLSFFVQGGFLSFELTADVSQWVNGAKPNYGWVILPWVNGNDGWFFGTAENANELYRPQLRVYYTPASTQPTIHIGAISRTATSATLNFTGGPNTTYTILRSTTVNAGYSSAGTAQTDGTGAGTFIDNAPPAGTAFYQITN